MPWIQRPPPRNRMTVEMSYPLLSSVSSKKYIIIVSEALSHGDNLTR